MDQKITRKFFKPVRGSGELRRDGERLAQVRFYLQGWQDFPADQPPPDPQEGADRKMSGMEGEITLSIADRNRVSPEQILYQELRLKTDRDQEYILTAYKVKEGGPAKGRYSVRCKLG